MQLVGFAELYMFEIRNVKSMLAGNPPGSQPATRTAKAVITTIPPRWNGRPPP
jgi:hypothetical protein